MMFMIGKEVDLERLRDRERIAYDLFSRGLALNTEQIKEYLDLVKALKGVAVWAGLIKQAEHIYRYYENKPSDTPELAFTEAVARDYEYAMIPVGIKKSDITEIQRITGEKI